MRTKIRRRAVLGGAAALAAPFIIGRRSRAAERSITVGIYTGPQGDYVRQKIIPPFEAKHNCKVYTTLGVTLEQIAALRATRNNPRYSVMFVDDVGVALGKSEGLMEKLPQEQIPNMQRLLKRFHFYGGYGAGFAMSMASLAYATQSIKPLETYAELWEPKFRQRFLMETPKATQSVYLLIAAVTLETGKPYAQAQYLINQAWPKMAALKPNVLSIFENETAVMQLIQGQADVAGLFYSKSVNPYTVKGAPVAMCYPREGTFAGINTPDPGQERARPRARHRLYRLDARPRGAARAGRGEPRRADHQWPGVQTGCRQIHRLSREQDGRDGDFQPRLDLHQSAPAQARRKV